MTLLIEDGLNESASVISNIDSTQIEQIASVMITTIKNGGKIIFFGNGGSASDAQHLAAELSGRYLLERPAMSGMALSSLSSITGIGNDYGYDMVFVRQIEAFVREGDAVVGISTSGNSENVLKAIKRAKELGAVTIAFTGSSGKLKDFVDLALTVPSMSTPRIQEGYLCAGHIICGLVESIVYGSSTKIE